MNFNNRMDNMTEQIIAELSGMNYTLQLILNELQVQTYNLQEMNEMMVEKRDKGEL